MTRIDLYHPWHLLALLVLMTVLSPGNANDAQNRASAISAALQEQLLLADALSIQPRPDWALLRQVYGNYNHRLLWHTPFGQLDEAGTALKQYIRDVAGVGLEPALYHAANINRYRTDDPVQQQVRDDLLLTDGFLRLARHLAEGQLDPTAVDPLWKIPMERIDSTGLLDQAVISLNPVSVLESLNPQNGGYQALLRVLSDYRRIASKGGWSPLPESPLLRPGEQNDLVPLLRQRLRVTGQLEEQAPPLDILTYDPDLQRAVERFQQAHGLKQDGIIGPQTRAALNVSVEQRIAQIESNLERWRWLPKRLGDRYILVNIGGYLVQLVEHDQVRLESRSIIGRPMRYTPSFSARATHLVLNPTWTVPRRIAVEDLLPAQRRDSEYLLRKNIQIQQRQGDQWVSQDPAMIDWGTFNRNNFPFRLQQSPGDGNSLGRIKFHMPNPYAIYLHDTPAKGLFSHPVRDFSSGCVRVEGIQDLARQLLVSEPETISLFSDRLASRQSSYFKLPEPIDIYLVYFTAWMDPETGIQFRPDIYDLDRPLMLSLRQLSPSQDKQFAHRETEPVSIAN